MTRFVTTVIRRGRAAAAHLGLLCLLLLLCARVGAVDTLGVIYPQVREPFSRVYADIIQGIREGFPGTVYEYPIDGDPLSLLRFRDASGGPDAYVVLGNKSLDAAAGLQKPLFAAIPELGRESSLSGAILLKPPAQVYMDRLLSIYPAVERVHVVYKPQQHQWLIDEARELLADAQKELNAVAVDDVRESARAFRQISREALPGDAVWLISDSGLIDSALLDVVLDSAWDKRLAVFTSNPSFAKRGALFAIYPDNIGIGRTLAEMIGAYEHDRGAFQSIRYLTDVKVAYNERTGNHIGIRLPNATRESIDLILPQY